MTFPRRKHRPYRVIKPARTSGDRRGCDKTAMFIAAKPGALALITAYIAFAGHRT